MFSLQTIAAPSSQFVPNLTLELYQHYRALVHSLINTADPQISYLVSRNSDIPGAQGYGVHERFVHYGRSVVELSVGELHYPWVAADGYPNTGVTPAQLLALAEVEPNELIEYRLRTIAAFAMSQPAYVRCYYYCNANGTVKAVTVEDEMNMLKFNMLVSHTSF